MKNGRLLIRLKKEKEIDSDYISHIIKIIEYYDICQIPEKCHNIYIPMALSTLQKYIIRQTGENPKNRLNRQIFLRFYENKKKTPPKELQTNIITKSIERLIEQGQLIGFGQKTQHKLFITHVRLSSRGKKTAKKLFGQQAELPIFKRSKK